MNFGPHMTNIGAAFQLQTIHSQCLQCFNQCKLAWHHRWSDQQ